MDETDILDFDAPECFPEEVENQLDEIIAKLNPEPTLTDSGFNESEFDFGDYDYVIDIFAMPREELTPTTSEVFTAVEDNTETEQQNEEQVVKVEVREIPRSDFEQDEQPASVDVKEDFIDFDGENTSSIVRNLRNRVIQNESSKKIDDLEEETKVITKIQTKSNASKRTKKTQALSRKNYILIPRSRVIFKILANDAKVLLVKDKENESNGWEFANFHNRGFKCPLCGKGMARRVNNVVWIKQPHSCRSLPFVVLKQKYDDLSKGIKITSQWWIKKEEEYNFSRTGKRVARRHMTPKVVKYDITIPICYERMDCWKHHDEREVIVEDPKTPNYAWGFKLQKTMLICMVCNRREGRLAKKVLPVVETQEDTFVFYHDVFVNPDHECKSFPMEVFEEKFEDEENRIKIDDKWWKNMEKKYNFGYFMEEKDEEDDVKSNVSASRSTTSTEEDETITIMTRYRRFGFNYEREIQVDDKKNNGRGWGFQPSGKKSLVCMLCDRIVAKYTDHPNIATKRGNDGIYIEINKDHGCDSIPLKVFYKKEDDQKKNIPIDRTWWKNMEKRFNFNKSSGEYYGPSEEVDDDKSNVSASTLTPSPEEDDSSKETITVSTLYSTRHWRFMKNQREIKVIDRKDNDRGWCFQSFGKASLVCILCDRIVAKFSRNPYVASKRGNDGIVIHINKDHGCNSIPLEVFDKREHDQEKNLPIDKTWWKNMEKRFNFNKFSGEYYGPEYGPSHFVEIPKEMFVLRKLQNAQEALLVRDKNDIFSGWEFVRYSSSTYFSCSICSKGSVINYQDGKLQVSCLHKCGTVPFFLLQEKYNTLEAGLSIDPGWWLKKQREHNFKRPDRTQTEKMVVCKNISWIEIYFDGNLHAIIIKDPNNEEKGWEFSCKSKKRTCRVCQTRRIIHTGQGFMMIDLNHECTPINIEFLTIKYDLMMEKYEENHSLIYVEKKEKNQKVEDVLKNLDNQNDVSSVAHPNSKKPLIVVSKTSDPDVQIIETMKSSNTKVQETNNGSTIFVSNGNDIDQRVKRKRKPTKIVVESQNEQVLKMLGEEALCEIKKNEQKNMAKKRRRPVNSANNSLTNYVPILPKRPCLATSASSRELSIEQYQSSLLGSSKSSSSAHENIGETYEQEQFLDDDIEEDASFYEKMVDDIGISGVSLDDLRSYRCPTAGEDDPIKRKKIAEQIVQQNTINMEENETIVDETDDVYGQNEERIGILPNQQHLDLFENDIEQEESSGNLYENYEEEDIPENYDYQLSNNVPKDVNQQVDTNLPEQSHSSVEQTSEFSLDTKVELIAENQPSTASNVNLSVGNYTISGSIQRQAPRKIVPVSQVPRMNYPTISPSKIINPNAYGQTFRVIAPKKYYRYTYEGSQPGRAPLFACNRPSTMPAPKITVNSNGQWRQVTRPANKVTPRPGTSMQYRPGMSTAVRPVLAVPVRPAARPVIRPAVRRQPSDQQVTDSQRIPVNPGVNHEQNLAIPVRQQVYDDIEYDDEDHEDDVFVLN